MIDVISFVVTLNPDDWLFMNTSVEENLI